MRQRVSTIIIRIRFLFLFFLDLIHPATLTIIRMTYVTEDRDDEALLILNSFLFQI